MTIYATWARRARATRDVCAGVGTLFLGVAAAYGVYAIWAGVVLFGGAATYCAVETWRFHREARRYDRAEANTQ